jgi:hypothetical protein
MGADLSVQSRKEEETGRKENWNSPSSERWMGADLCRARNGNWTEKTMRNVTCT